MRSSELVKVDVLLAAEMIATQPDVAVTLGAAVIPFSRAGAPFPLAFVFSGDPVAAGLVESLARPGRNMTGMTLLSAELVGKRMDVLRQALPLTCLKPTRSR